MVTAPNSSQAERLRAQITRMVKGNGIPPDAVTVQSEHITHVKLLGQLDIRLSIKADPSSGKGAPHSHWRQSFDTMAELNAALAELQTQTRKDEKNLAYAADQILLEANQGWGLTGSGLPISHLNFEIGAREECRHCEGQKTDTCKTCSGQKRQECGQCRGRRDMPCQICYGRGVSEGGEDCTACRKTGQITCIGCQGQGEIICRACAGKGQIPCEGCDALGKIWQQIAFRVFAQTNFKMQLDGEYQGDILQHLRRLRPEHLLDGHADIYPGEKNLAADALQVAYHAEFPIIQIDFKIADKNTKFVLLGKNHAMIDTPHFMDPLLMPSIDLLRRAQKRQQPAQSALAALAKIRFFRDALMPGKKLHELRRHYPFGVSIHLMQEIAHGLQYLLSILTERPRLIAATGFNAVLAIAFYLHIKNHPGAHSFGFDDVVTWATVIFLNLMVMVSTHYGVTYNTLKSFKIEPNLNDISIAAAIGKIGFISIGVSFVLCLLSLILH